MKKILILTVAFLLAACGSQSEKGVDQTSPEKVVEAVFKAAVSGEFETLRGLCDPQAGNDRQTQRICEVADGSFAEEFVEYFKNGKVAGPAEIKDDEARVPILFGPKGDEEETMVLIKRENKWYLYGI